MKNKFSINKITHIVTVKLTQGKLMIIDESQMPIIAPYKWHANRIGNTFYAQTNLHKNGRHTVIRVHRLLMNCLPGDNLIIDHIDGNGLNNTLLNLRTVTKIENAHNEHGKRTFNNIPTSQFPGVHWDKKSRKWMSRIRTKGKRIFLGCFSTEEDAAKAYVLAKIKRNKIDEE
jgi:hypothetical protein